EMSVASLRLVRTRSYTFSMYTIGVSPRISAINVRTNVTPRTWRHCRRIAATGAAPPAGFFWLGGCTSEIPSQSGWPFYHPDWRSVMQVVVGVGAADHL